MATASLTASLLARKGTAKPGALLSGELTPQQSSSYSAQNPWSTKEKQGAKKQTVTHLHSAQKAQPTCYKTVRKSVTIEAVTDKKLRVLAAARGISQQQLVAEILSNHLTQIYTQEGCVCGAHE